MPPRNDMLIKKFLHPLRDEGILRGTTQFRLKGKKSRPFQPHFSALTGCSVADYFSSPAKSALWATGEFGLYCDPGVTSKGFHLSLPSR